MFLKGTGRIKKADSHKTIAKRYPAMSAARIVETLMGKRYTDLITEEKKAIKRELPEEPPEQPPQQLEPEPAPQPKKKKPRRMKTQLVSPKPPPAATVSKAPEDDDDVILVEVPPQSSGPETPVPVGQLVEASKPEPETPTVQSSEAPPK